MGKVLIEFINRLILLTLNAFNKSNPSTIINNSYKYINNLDTALLVNDNLLTCEFGLQ